MGREMLGRASDNSLHMSNDSFWADKPAFLSGNDRGLWLKALCTMMMIATGWRYLLSLNTKEEKEL